MGYLNLVGSFIYKEPLFRSKLDALAENDAQLKTDGWAQNTKTLFYQAAVPTGWTQDVSQNDKALRLVGSTGGAVSGGSTALSSTITAAHTHTLPTPSDGSHTHGFANHTHLIGSGTTNIRPSTNFQVADNSGFLFAASPSGGSSSVTQLKGPWKTPGAVTLSTQAAHSHGTPGTSLTDFAFAYCDVILGAKNAPGGTYTDLTSFWHTGDKVDFDPFVEYANNDAYNLANLMPSGTLVIFGQSSAPTGWTKNISLSDRMLRVVGGAGGGNGGSTLLSSGVSLSHGHSLATVADHTHSIPSHTHTLTNGTTSNVGFFANPSQFGWVPSNGTLLLYPTQSVGAPTSSQASYKNATVFSGGTTGAAGGHTHQLVSSLADFVLAYVDVIKCSKDSGGEPQSYTDMTAVFAWKKLVSKQRLNSLAQNDAMIQYHTTPSGSQAFFYMSSPPAGWTKITSQHDKALRMVDGSSGGTPGGGSQTLSSPISLAHTHTIVAQANHTHVDGHTHTVDSANQTGVAGSTGIVDNNGLGAPNPGQVLNGGRFLAQATNAPVEQPDAAGGHDHGTTTNSQLTDVTLAYADVIWCEKN